MKLLFWIAAFAFSRIALAGAPFVTDDPEPTPPGHYELYLAGAYANTDDRTAAAVPQLEADYGAFEDVQLHAVVNFALSTNRGQSTQAGISDTEVGIKYRFVDLPESGWQIGVFPLVEIPTGSQEKGIGTGYAQVFLPLWIEKDFENGRTYGGGGWWYHPGEGNSNYVRLGWALEYDFSPMLTLGAELYHHSTDLNGGEGTTAFSVGGLLHLSEHAHFLASVGRDFGSELFILTYGGFLFTF